MKLYYNIEFDSLYYINTETHSVYLLAKYGSRDWCWVRTPYAVGLIQYDMSFECIGDI
jgi:hypothetical protein